MSTQTEQPMTETSSDTDDAPKSDTVEDLQAQNELLREENQRLRTQYAQTKRTEYRRAALGIILIGVAATLGGVVFPGSQTTLFALAGIGLFTGVLTYYLTPEQFVTASVGERTYAALATLGGELVSELGLQETCVYVPTERSTNKDTPPVRLFVPEHSNYLVPKASDLGSLFVVTDNERAHGIAVPPTGAALFTEFTEMITDSLANTPEEIGEQVTEALVEGFELAETAVLNLDAEHTQLTIGISGSAFGDVGRFDHPMASFIATALAVGLETPIWMDTATPNDDRFDYVLTYEWEEDSDTDAEPE